MIWGLDQLEALFAKRDGWAVRTEDDSLCISNEDGLDAYVAISGAQIVVESILFPKSLIADAPRLNEEILKTHQLFALTTIAITAVEGEDYYMAFGALSSQSKEESISIEVETLFANVTSFLDAYENHIN